MIIKSMSRKHPSFAQLIDYIEAETKLKSREFSIYQNLYSRDRDRLKEEFAENARHLRFRKNGVYLYHEVVSITRSRTLTDAEQKAALQTIVSEYLNARAKHQLAYAVLHEDTDHLHFHIVLSANEAGDTSRKRLSKAQFSDIQTRLEAWVLQTHPELEQQAVFHKNQTREERKEREAKRQHLSNQGEELKRRGGKTETRDQVQETLAEIFSSARDPRHFSELMEREGFTLYTRGQAYGVTDRAGNKYRLNRLGLSEAWQALDRRMTETIHADRQATRPTEDTPQHHATTRPGEATERQANTKGTSAGAYEAEAEQRLAEMKAHRARQAARDQQQASTQSKKEDRER